MKMNCDRTLLLLSATGGLSKAVALTQYTPDIADWTTLNEKSVLNHPLNTDHTPDGVHWIDRADWLPWDGTAYNASQYSKSELANLICPGNTIRGLREVFYEHNPFYDPVNPTKAEVDAWHAIAINHVRAMVGYTEEEYQIEPDKCLHVRALWSDERMSTRMWDEKYPGGCEGTTNPHCGAGFIPAQEDQGPYLPDGIEYCGKTAGSEGLFNSAKSNIPWSIRWARPLCYTLGAEGFWGGHTGPWFHRKKFGLSWRDGAPANTNSNAGLRAKWSGTPAPSKYEDPRVTNGDHLILAEDVDPNPRFPGFECKQRIWMTGGSPNATDCYKRVMDDDDCGKRFVTYNSGGCACYPVEMDTCVPMGVAGRRTWDLDPQGNSFDGLMIETENPLWNGRECNNIKWKGDAARAGDAAHCLQKLMEAQYPDCGRSFMTWNSANGGCACYGPEQTCDRDNTAGRSGRITYKLLDDPAYEPAPAPVATTVPSAPPTTPSTRAPTDAPSEAPTHVPTNAPSHSPSEAPTHASTDAPSRSPTDAPSEAPARDPTNTHSNSPTDRTTSQDKTCMAKAIEKKWEPSCKTLTKKAKCGAEVLCKWNKKGKKGNKCGHLFSHLCKKAKTEQCSKLTMKGKAICEMK